MSALTYAEALAWLYSFSDFERTGAFDRSGDRNREDNLARMRALLAPLSEPQRAYGVTHIAGTKGKGSTSAMLAGILRAAGARVGLYTQPDLHTFRERIQVDGAPISEGEVARLVPLVRSAAEQVDPALGPLITYEVSTALAFLAFREARVAHSVIEVGLGGRLDATNVVQPLATAITSISYDHMAVLGNTLAEIAGQKAGIIKPLVPVITSVREPEALDVITQIAHERRAPLVRVGPAGEPDCDVIWRAGEGTSEWQVGSISTALRDYRSVRLAMLGTHQIENAAVAVALAESLTEVLAARGIALDEAAIREGMATVRWPARLQVVAREPWIIVDGAHNAASFARLFEALRRHFTFERLVLVMGTMTDKDITGIVREVAQGAPALVVATAARSPRALPPADMGALLRQSVPQAEIVVAADADAALALAVAQAGPRDLICVAGSLYLAGEALRYLARQPYVIPGAIEIAGIDHP
ncbi:MAG TPA: folylpolyglutamate synthase/dihydrofolate synthase family protein [Ktedonobacterales bacterium]